MCMLSTRLGLVTMENREIIVIRERLLKLLTNMVGAKEVPLRDVARDNGDIA